MMKLKKAPQKGKPSAFKEFIASNQFFVMIISMVLIVGFVLAIVLPLYFAPTYTVQANVSAVGYSGITIEYRGKYGKVERRKIDVEDVSKYQEGDTITIEIKAWEAKIVERCGE